MKVGDRHRQAGKQCAREDPRKMNAYHHIDVERIDQFGKFLRIFEIRDAAMEKISLFYRRS